MTPKDGIKEALDGLAQFIIMNDTGTDESASAIEWHGIVTKALTELEELKRDVRRFIELLMKDNHTGRDTFDIEILKDKLLKVGVENE